MSNFIMLFTLFVIAIILFMKSEIMASDVHYVVSEFDNQKYLVRQLNDEGKAADLLAQIRRNLSLLTTHLQTNFPQDPRTQRISRRFNANNIMENYGNSKYTAYSVNKGEKMVLCLRYRDGTDKLVDLNTIMFVTLHEYSHILTKTVDHTDEFWENFKFVLQNAIKLGIYKCVDYSAAPQKYCGIEVNNSPLKCSDITQD